MSVIIDLFQQAVTEGVTSVTPQFIVGDYEQLNKDVDFVDNPYYIAVNYFGGVLNRFTTPTQAVTYNMRVFVGKKSNLDETFEQKERLHIPICFQMFYELINELSNKSKYGDRIYYGNNGISENINFVKDLNVFDSNFDQLLFTFTIRLAPDLNFCIS